MGPARTNGADAAAPAGGCVPPSRRPSAARVALALTVLLGASACATLPPLDGRTESNALVAPAGTPLHDALAPLTAAHPGSTGILPLGDGRAAFVARAVLAEAAQHSLDVQYYIWHADVSGRLLFEALRQAADRGVRVRLLLDDNNTGGMDPLLAALDAHPNVEVRLFNPFPNRSSRYLGYLTDFGRLNRRMHNKSFTADGVVTIVGGRNIGDEYFAAGDGIGFLDLDVVAIGAVVPAVAKSFDDYWHSRSAYPADRLLPAVAPADVAAVEARSRAAIESPEAMAYVESLRETQFALRALQGATPWEWTTAHLVVDDPAKGLAQAQRKDYLMSSLEHVVGPARREVHVVSPYFVPMKQGVDAFTALEERGVQVKILTNSLEATDVAAVHAGYAKRRRALLDGGVELYELKRSAAAMPVTGPVQQRMFSGSGGGSTGGSGGGSGAAGGEGAAGGSAAGSSGGASLHAKTFAVDRERVFVGSFNFDPRSAALNTEMGLVLESPTLANRLADAFEQGIPEASYEVRRAPDGRGLQWVERDDGGETVHETEPGTTGFQRAAVGTMALLPIDWLL
jgi:putative cardiolipin synthase